MNSIGDRIKELRLKQRMTQKELAKAVGVTSTAVSQWERSENEPKGKNLAKLSSKLKTTIDWLSIALPPPVAMVEHSELICSLVSFYPTVSAAGGSGTCVSEESEDYTAIPNSALKGKNINDIACITVAGDSMSPVAPDGSIIAIDRKDNMIRDGKIYVFRHEGLLRVKLLKQKPYQLQVHSLNPEYEDELYDLDSLSDFDIVGRVFWVSLSLL